jgi:purine-cytosine permease-like protein
VTSSAENKQHETLNEYEREPVPEKALLGLKSFVGQYVGEHVAGTELMIGPLFVASGVSAFDLVVGLLLGNLLAVLSWTFLTAPIATRQRLTLYCQLEKVCGRRLVVLYDAANGVMFTLLAGAMITVSATAVGVGFDFRMPGLNDYFPNSAGWVVTVLIVGALFTAVAAYGYKFLARFANIAAPWMIAVFLCFGIIALARFRSLTGAQISSPGDLWRLANAVIWKGGSPFPGQVKFTFWHVLFFAWFCNMAWHIGMADLSVFRYARKSWYGVSSAAGMYVGHFMAWICAAMLYALQLYEVDLTPAELASLDRAGLLQAFTSHRMWLDAAQIRDLIEKGILQGPPAVLPGPMTYRIAGLAGLLCVIAAGWTTANPTLYRAGLAFQAIVPRSSRFIVTLLTGAVASVTAVFPLVSMRLLGFVAMWGMILMPMGAVIFVDFWLSKRLGFRRDYAEFSGTSFNWAAGLAWLLTIAVCVGLVLRGGVQIYFVSLPGWFVAAFLYVGLSRLWQKRSGGLSPSGVAQPMDEP